jgi:membrane-associated PAP2 superfamily phosphatase
MIDYVALAISAVLILVLSLLRWKNDRPLAHFVIAALVGIVLNDFLTGALFAVHDRYGSRVIWLLPLVGIFLLLRSIRARQQAGK